VKPAGRVLATGFLTGFRGFTVDFATPNGRPAPVDPSSVSLFKDKESADFMKRFMTDGKILQCHKLSMVALADYSVIFFPGGHGPMFDLAQDKEMAKLVSEWFCKGDRRVLSAVCHGSAAFLPMTGPDGKPLVNNHTVCCFTDSEEHSMKMDKEMPFLLESKLRQLGAKTIAAKDMAECVFSDCAGNNSHIITGQNPASARPVAQAIVKAVMSQ
jgi:putative intracellular protease/amidase